ncbi:MAG: nucleotidyltransferase domain-containing protein [Nanoarchaeota archaeon]
MYKAYASYFVSYLLSKIKDLNKINRIILFGSVAKNQATKESDVDIFIELEKSNIKIEKEINEILEDFYKSKEGLLFRTKGISNKINLIIGKLDEWKELKLSIESEGIILYGKFESKGKSGKKFIIIYWDNIKKNRGAFLNKIYGFKIKDKRYKGLIEEFDGKKLGKSCVMIPVIYRERFVDLLKKYEVNAKIIEVYY